MSKQKAPVKGNDRPPGTELLEEERPCVWTCADTDADGSAPRLEKRNTPANQGGASASSAPGAWPQTWMHSLLVLDPAVQNLGVQFSGSGSEGSVVRAAPPARPVSAFAPCPCPSRTPVTGLSPAPSRGWFHLGTLSSESHLHRSLCKMRSHLEVLGVRARSSLFGATV